jgi:hypothetical protein
MNHPATLTPETVAEMRVLRLRGHPYTEIVRIVGVSKTMVHKYCAGLHPRLKSGRKRKQS